MKAYLFQLHIHATYGIETNYSTTYRVIFLVGHSPEEEISFLCSLFPTIAWNASVIAGALAGIMDHEARISWFITILKCTQTMPALDYPEI